MRLSRPTSLLVALLLALLVAPTAAFATHHSDPADEPDPYDIPEPTGPFDTDYQQVVDITFPFRAGTTVSYRDDYHDPRSTERMHQSTDLMAAGGTPVYAAVSGFVRHVSGDQDSPPSYGWMVSIRGDDGRAYSYIHLGTQDGPPSKAYAPGISRGERVWRGQLVGYVGCSGTATCGGGEHLHFEIRDDHVIDPYDHHDHQRINPYASLRAAERRGDYADPAYAGPLRDVRLDSVHYHDILHLRRSGITRGCNDTGDRFCPTDAVTRAQMASFLQRLHRQLASPPTLAPRDVVSFSDIAGSVHATDISWLSTSGVTRGCATQPARFCPSDHVTRGQMAAFLARALKLPAAEVPFSDTADHLFERDIGALASAGITKGCNDQRTRFCPDEPVTRAQMASFLVRALAQ